MADRIAVMSQGRVQQVAAPEELYRAPANRFVAEFIGRSNIFEGTAVADGLAATSTGDAGGRVLPGHGQGRYLVVRPEDIAITARGRATGSVLSGRVLETQFSGGSTTIAVSPQGVETAARQPVLVTQPGFPTVERGAEVELTWSAAAAAIVA